LQIIQRLSDLAISKKIIKFEDNIKVFGRMLKKNLKTNKNKEMRVQIVLFKTRKIDK
jgi:hypothetical protein